MEVLFDIIRKVESLNADVFMKKLLSDKAFQNAILDLNLYNQLFEKGIDSKGRSLGPYRPLSIKIRKDRGLQTDHVQLFFEGEFYASFYITVGSGYFEINGNPLKPDKDLTEVYGEDIFGLTEESKEILVEWLIEEFRPVILEYLFAA
jgi:hypothetical protein